MKSAFVVAKLFIYPGAAEILGAFKHGHLRIQNDEGGFEYHRDPIDWREQQYASGLKVWFALKTLDRDFAAGKPFALEGYTESGIVALIVSQAEHQCDVRFVLMCGVRRVHNKVDLNDLYEKYIAPLERHGICVVAYWVGEDRN